jgi:hypothetical protein
MVKIALILTLGGLAVYFGMVLFVIPHQYSVKTLEPNPIFTAEISSKHVTLGDSFDMVIDSANYNDPADIQIMSISFPNMSQIGNKVKITSYNFTQPPRYIKTGDKIGYDYSGGTKSVSALYPSIEAYSRPVNPNIHHLIELEITPDAAGNFTVFAKTVAIPHGNNSHFPHSGIKDHQNEYVESFSVMVGQ